ncbi:BTB/POZ domain-containing protein [Candidatus Protochlamydia amoebophila]|uniref:BTB/POZ domain-containing protein n=1 Tax=Candidatus Protochlamydia amoebophila TaxID=362787 RepID=UPI0000352D21|nr:BTB/POZ domain-containing protein [Candidatus Protochlamydia amoebophila]
MTIHNLRFTPKITFSNPATYYYESNNCLKFSERVSLFCITIFQSFLNLFFGYLKKDQLQTPWRENFWSRKEITIPKFITSRPPSSDISLTRIRSQETINNLEYENEVLLEPSNTLEGIEAFAIQSSSLSPLPQVFKVRFQNNTFLNITSSQKSLLMEKSPYFRVLWSGNFKETLQNPLVLTQKEEFTSLLFCLMNANFKVPVEDITSFIQLADYYLLTDVVKNLEEQLIDAYKSEELDLFNFNEENLAKLRESLNFAHQYRLSALKNYLQPIVASLLLNQTPHLAEFKKILNYFSNEIEKLNFSENAHLTDAHLLALKNCKNLKALHLQACHNLTDDGLASLTSLTNLQYLNLSCCDKLTNKGLAHFKSLIALQYLNLSGCAFITDAGLAHLKPLVALQYLNLSGCAFITDAGLAHLKPLVALQYLNLSGCAFITDAGLAHLTPLVTLKHLDLSWCNSLTNAGLERLASLVALQHLNLSGCIYLTEAGLTHLTSLTNLQQLNLNHCEHFADVRFKLTHFRTLLANPNLILI